MFFYIKSHKTTSYDAADPHCFALLYTLKLLPLSMPDFNYISQISGEVPASRNTHRKKIKLQVIVRQAKK